MKSNPFFSSCLKASEGRDRGGICTGQKYDTWQMIAVHRVTRSPLSLRILAIHLTVRSVTTNEHVGDIKAD